MGIQNKLPVQIDDEISMIADEIGVSRGELIALRDKDPNSLTGEQRQLYEQQLGAHRELAKRRSFYANELQNVSSPADLGVPIEFRRIQRAGLDALAKSFMHYNRGFLDMPTGSGKTMLIGAQIRAFLEYAKAFDMLDEVEVLVLTSRLNLASQMLADCPLDDDSDDEFREDAMKIGDVQLWLKGICNEVRVITCSSNESDRHRNSPVTVTTYQGLHERTFLKYFENERKIGLIIADECHNITDRIRRLLQDQFGHAWLTGYSATPAGPERNPYDTFECMIYRESLREMIERGELKQVRVIRVNTDIDMSDVRINKGNFVPLDVEKVLSRNQGVLNDVVLSTLRKTYPLLREIGETPLVDRQSLFFVTRIKQAEELAKELNRIGMPAMAVSGETPAHVFDKHKEQFRRREIRAIVSARKITEGFDAENVEAVHMLQPLGEGSGWLYKQEIGRGLRIDPSNPFASCVIVDYLYVHDRYLPFSAHEALELSEYREAALLVPSGMRDVEQKVLVLRKDGKSFAEIYNLLNDDEKIRFLHLIKAIPKDASDRIRFGSVKGGSEPMDIGVILGNIEILEEVRRRIDLRTGEEDREKLKILARQILEEKGVKNRAALLTRGPTWFTYEKFAPFGKGTGFASMLVGRPVIVKNPELREIADFIYGKETEQQRLENVRTMLLKRGVTDRDSFMLFGIRFFQEHFKDYGSGLVLAKRILHRALLPKEKTRTTMSLIADILYGSQQKERVVTYRKVLEANGIRSVDDLVTFGSGKFIRTKFPPYGNGPALANYILMGNCPRFITRETLRIIGEVVFENAGIIDYYRKMLEAMGIKSSEDLISCGVSRFEQMDFGNYGNGAQLARRALGLGRRKKMVFGEQELRNLANKVFGTLPES
ncbi:MAG: DEAD/DEAH box helicase family protein [Patescibacteria group bacterium]|nr:DEAD/DEAH box helicase family protein [Patescibacteria group bacterium]